ncbi:hypothetical protein F0Q01_02975 [Pseudobutyrivibrio xylanivorans]|uniref:Cobalamin biosynthesis protein CbiG n=2 Tax=Lachnospiraceae TaxID=186803 RepID=A0A6M0LIS1_PSEXY|nr:hypothetical protein [Pseudobutyrivibrio xylanivorans]
MIRILKRDIERVMKSKKIIRVAYFTDTGKELALKLFDDWDKAIPEYRNEQLLLNDWVQDSFENHLPILFIGAVGIAVRAIAPFVNNKLKDSAVVVTDELGLNVIPILSGHFGGANDWARAIAEKIDSNPVITTATDINNVFAVDVFARENGFKIKNKEMIKVVSTKALKGEKLNAIETQEYLDIDGLWLVPKRLTLGIGCKKGKTFKELFEFVTSVYDEEYLYDNLYAISSIDVKVSEIGLIKLAQYFGVPFITFSADELLAVEGDFNESDFVKENVGVGNVCERSALLAAGEESTIIKEKKAFDGMTLAAARREKIVIDW